jgi:hypothetical protein
MSIKSWFIGKLKTALQNHNTNRVQWSAPDESTLAMGRQVSVAGPKRLRSNGMEFTLYVADGGYVLEYHSYDHKTDEQHNRIHLIPDSHDFGDQLSKIITMELLRR